MHQQPFPHPLNRDLSKLDLEDDIDSIREEGVIPHLKHPQQKSS